VMVVNGTDSPALRVTACMANLGVDTFIADLHSDWEGSEPAMSWNRPAQRYSTATTRTQLGAVLPRQPLNDRGVLALAPPLGLAVLIRCRDILRLLYASRDQRLDLHAGPRQQPAKPAEHRPDPGTSQPDRRPGRHPLPVLDQP
jgi:hypothetical protein